MTRTLQCVREQELSIAIIQYVEGDTLDSTKTMHIFYHKEDSEVYLHKKI